MKLKNCLELGKDCGLSTWEECYDNVYMHAGQIFSYDRIAVELLELQKEMFKTDPDKFCKIFNSNKEELISKGW